MIIYICFYIKIIGYLFMKKIIKLVRIFLGLTDGIKPFKSAVFHTSPLLYYIFSLNNVT
jgi:hypothetical protein